MARAGGEKNKRPEFPAFSVNARLLFLKSEFFLQVVDIGSTVLEVLVIHDTDLQVNVGFDTVDDQFLQCVFHTGDSDVAVFTIADQLTDH